MWTAKILLSLEVCSFLWRRNFIHIVKIFSDLVIVLIENRRVAFNNDNLLMSCWNTSFSGMLRLTSSCSYRNNFTPSALGSHEKQPSRFQTFKSNVQNMNIVVNYENVMASPSNFMSDNVSVLPIRTMFSQIFNIINRSEIPNLLEKLSLQYF